MVRKIENEEKTYATIMTKDELIRNALEESALTKQKMIASCGDDLKTAASWVAEAMKRGNSLLICGNGGSAADSQHIATEFVVRLTAKSRRGALPAIALTTDTSTLTAAANDFGFERIFARQVEALGRTGDILMVISTSGKSPNLIAAAKEAKNCGIKVIAFLGQNKNELGKIADLCMCIPSGNSQRVQEGHITAGHLLVALTEKHLAELP